MRQSVTAGHSQRHSNQRPRMNRKHEVKRTMRIGQVLDSRDFSMKRRECITDTSCKRRYLQAAIDVAAFPMGEAHTHRLRTSDRVMAPDDYKPPYGRQGCGHAEVSLSPRMWSSSLACYSPTSYGHYVWVPVTGCLESPKTS